MILKFGFGSKSPQIKVSGSGGVKSSNKKTSVAKAGHQISNQSSSAVDNDASLG